MIRVSETVLPGHPDKFCDLVADAIVQEATRLDRDAYAQVEVGVWSDQMWLSGRVASCVPFEKPINEIVRSTGAALGLDAGNWIDASRYRITATVCFETCDPTVWTHHVNDQSIVIGWAGYDARLDYLPPEHFLALRLRDALFHACRGGRLRGHGPDGKILVRLREQGGDFVVEHLLVTLQHREDADFMGFLTDTVGVLADAYNRLRTADGRWLAPFRDIEVLVNPNGPLVQAGSDGDNGQTGRKLVADHYGPRIAIGGGALAGKHWTHIDRIAAAAARQAAIDAVSSGAETCRIQLVYAPGIDAPLDVAVDMTGRGISPGPESFGHAAMCRRLSPNEVYSELRQFGRGPSQIPLRRPSHSQVQGEGLDHRSSSPASLSLPDPADREASIMNRDVVAARMTAAPSKDLVQ
jgi:S-adenosylmethionine synthetase